MDANRLLVNVASAYAQMSSYRDDGVVIQKLPTAQGSVPYVTQFSTVYLKPNLFRFKFASPHPYPPLAHVISTHICGFDGATVYLWTQHHDKPAKVQLEARFGMAVAGATGISGRSVNTIASLLFPELVGVRITDLKQAMMDDDEDFEGTRCHVVRAQNPGGYEETIWVDHTTLTIRKAARGSQFPSEEIRRNIRVNEPIEAQIFVRPEGIAER